FKMGLKSVIQHLSDYLEDPYKVAKFQQICGIDKSPLQEAEGEPKDGPRQRRGHPASDCCKNGLRNGVLPPPPEHAGRGAACPSPGEEEEGYAGAFQKAEPAGGETTSARRKNSLTGEVGQEFRVRNAFLYYLFTFGTELGNELFYITFFPFWLWNVDAYVGRRVIVVWVWVMYLGQCTKDLIRRPRPASPPVVKVEMFYNSEYSMPSTHAMSGTAIPFSLFLLTYGRWEYPFMLGLLLALCWSSLVCLSRIYMGMHSILDIIAGVLYAILILVLFHPALDLIDNFNLTYKYAPLIILSLHLAMGIFSFTLDTWSTSRGDTAQILGSGAGIACASNVTYVLGLMPDPPLDMLPFTPVITMALFGKAMLRFLVGVVVLLMIRAVMKKVTIPLFCKMFGIPCGDVRKARQHMEIELPYRYFTYGMVGFGALFVVPCTFKYLNLF
uniref:Sphingosine-1-phosphate phosphatase 1 n=1 Tax=Latimeria chalumnae TaxID=7897 RepID=H3BDE1_LATCH